MDFPTSAGLRLTTYTNIFFLQIDVEFKPKYLELADSTDVIGTEIISHARNTEEVNNKISN